MQSYIEILKSYYNKIGKNFDEIIEDLANIIFKIHKHFTLKDVMKKNSHKNIDKKDVQEILRDMVSTGLIRSIHLNNRIYYEQIYGHAHHDHLICARCNKIIPFMNNEIEDTQRKITEKEGFEFLKHSMTIYGICPECQKKKDTIEKYEFQKEDKGLEDEKIIPLSMIVPGETVKVVDVKGGKHFYHRLMSMGLSIGDTLEVLSNDFHGPFLVKIKNTRLGIGHRMAHKILVEKE